VEVEDGFRNGFGGDQLLMGGGEEVEAFIDG
jgi:hypothetical protein